MKLLQTLCLLSVATLLRSAATPKRLNPYDDRCIVRFSESKAEDCTSVGYYFDRQSRLCKRTCTDEAPFESSSKCSRRCRSVVVCFIPRRPHSCGDVPTVTVYYFDVNKGRCLAEGGCTYNGNNFPTLGECERTCGVSSQAPGEATSGTQFGARNNQTWKQQFQGPYTHQRAPPVVAPLNNATGGEYPTDVAVSSQGVGHAAGVTNYSPGLGAAPENTAEVTSSTGRHEGGVEYPAGIAGSTPARREVGNSTNDIYYRTDSRCRYQVQETILKNCSSVKYYFDHGSSVCKSTCSTEAPFKTGWECSWICRSVINCFIQRPAVPCAGRQRATIYYFDLFKGMCLPQQGCTYRGNNFPTLQECERTCGVYTGTKREAQVGRHTGYVVPSTGRSSKPLMGAPNAVTDFSGTRQPNNAEEPAGGSESNVRRSAGGTGSTEMSESGLGHSNTVVSPARGNAAGREHNNMPMESGAGNGISASYPTGITNSPLENGERFAFSTHATHTTTDNEPDLRNPVGVPGSTGSRGAEAGYTGRTRYSTDGNISRVHPQSRPVVRNSTRGNGPVDGPSSGARSSRGSARRGGHRNGNTRYTEVNRTDVRHHTVPATSSVGNGEETEFSRGLGGLTGGRGTEVRYSSGKPQHTEQNGYGVRYHPGAGRSTGNNEIERAYSGSVTGSTESGNSNVVSYTSEGSTARVVHRPDVMHSTIGNGRYANLRDFARGLRTEGGAPNNYAQSSANGATVVGYHSSVALSTAGNVADAGHRRGLVGFTGGRRSEHGNSHVASHAPNRNVAGVGVSSGATGTTTSSLTGKVYPDVMGQSTGSGASLATYPLGLTETQILKGAATVQEIFSAIQEFIGALPFNSLRKRNWKRTRRQDGNNGTA